MSSVTALHLATIDLCNSVTALYLGFYLSSSNCEAFKRHVGPDLSRRSAEEYLDYLVTSEQPIRLPRPHMLSFIAADDCASFKSIPCMHHLWRSISGDSGFSDAFALNCPSDHTHALPFHMSQGGQPFAEHDVAAF